MPREFDESLDEPLVFDGQNALLQQRSFGRPNLLGATEAAEIRNMTPDSSGVLRSRRGFWYQAFPGSGAVQAAGFYDGTTDYAWVIRGGILYRYDSSMNEVSLDLTGVSPPFSTSSVAYTCQIADRLYASTAQPNEKIISIDIEDIGTVNDDTGVDVSTGASLSGYRLLTVNGYRIFCVNGQDNVYVTDILPDASHTGGAGGSETGLFDHSGDLFLRVGSDNEAITAMYSWQDTNLLVFKRNSMFVIDVNVGQVFENTASDITNFKVRQLSNKIGCVAHRSVQQVGNDAMFLSRDGIRSIGRIINDGMASTNEPLSVPIQDLIDRINWSEADKSVSAYRNRKYILAVPLDESTSPDTVIVYDTTVNGWSYWTGVEFAELYIERFSDIRLSGVTTDGSVVQFRDHVPESNLVAEDHYDFAAARIEASSWSKDADGYVVLNFASPPTGLSVGQHIRIVQLLNNGSAVAAFTDLVSRVTDVAGNAVTLSTATDQTPTGTTTVSLVPGSHTDWLVKTKAFTFGEPINQKTLDHVEVEFARDSSARVDVDLIIDAADPVELSGNIRTSGGNAVTIPVSLPFTLPVGKVSRRRIAAYGDFEAAREFQIQITEADDVTGGDLANSGLVALRSITAAGFIEEMEDIDD